MMCKPKCSSLEMEVQGTLIIAEVFMHSVCLEGMTQEYSPLQTDKEQKVHVLPYTR